MKSVSLILLLIFSATTWVAHTPTVFAQDGFEDELGDELDTLDGDLEGDLDLGDDLEGVDSGLDATELDADTDEGDLDASFGEEEVEADLIEDTSPPPPEALEEDFQAVEPPPAEETFDAPPEIPPAQPVTITGVDFDGRQNGGTIIISATGPLTYSTRNNVEGTQYILELQNASLPERFKRPYDTKEFNSTIGLFQGYQSSDATTARFVIQLREPVVPTIVPEGNKLLVSTGGGGALAQNEAPLPEPEQVIEEPPPVQEDISMQATPATSTKQWDDSRALNTRTLDEFLLSNKEFYGHPISIEVKNTDIRDVFNFIGEESGLNLVLSDGVQGKVTLKLREIPWDQALVVLMQSKQLGYVRQGNILRIETLSSIRAETDATRQLLESQRQLQPLRVQIFPVSYARAKQLEPQIKDFLSTRGKVNADERTNALVVTDIAENLSKIQKLLQTLDTQTPQVLIEGKVVEARESFEKRFGFALAGAGASADVFEWVTNETSPDRVQFTPSLSFNNSAGQSNSLGFTLATIDILGDLTATLDMLESESVVRVVSSPRVVTLNNIEALIKQTTEVPIFTTSVEDGESSTTVEYKELNLQLRVTPQITADGGIIMKMFIERQFAGETVTVGDASAAPIFGRSAQTTVLVNNGETAVIGGIYQNDVTKGESGVPLLKDIPILGALFRQSSKEQEKNELLIFLTPRVLNREQAFGVGSSDDLIEDFGAPPQGEELVEDFSEADTTGGQPLESGNDLDLELEESFEDDLGGGEEFGDDFGDDLELDEDF